MKKEDRKSKQSEAVPPKVNLWMVTTVVLGIAFIIVLMLFLQSGGSEVPADNTISATVCGMQIVNYINSNFVEPGTTATFVNAVERNGVYQIDTNYQNNTVSVYATQDCTLLFLQYVDVKNVTPVPTTTPPPTLVKSAVPTVDLYVMSFCPYGVQAENSMAPVVNLLQKKADITVRYIASVNGDTINSVSSLHGLNEAKEDVRQLCIAKYYPESFWSYLTKVNDQCYPLAMNETALDACWKGAATGLGMNVTTIESCAYGQEGIELLRSDATLAKQGGITASPSLFINGQKYMGTRSADAFKVAICNAFETPPAECSVNLTSNITPASGSCG
jgi:glutaredoxin